MSLIALLRERDYRATFDQKFDLEWSDDQLLSHIIALDCGGCQLTILPNLPNCRRLCCERNQLATLPDLSNCQELYCDNNRLTTLPDLPNCQILTCNNNQLTTLPDLPNCRSLYCSRNHLTDLPNLPNCEKLTCDNNRLTTLPGLPNCRELHCSKNQLTNMPDLSNISHRFRYVCRGNQMPFEGLDQWKVIWKARKSYLSIKYLHLWYRRMLQLKAQKKQKLHLELLWSPETRFYQRTEEYRHFVESSQAK